MSVCTIENSQLIYQLRLRALIKRFRDFLYINLLLFIVLLKVTKLYPLQRTLLGCRYIFSPIATKEVSFSSHIPFSSSSDFYNGSDVVTPFFFHRSFHFNGPERSLLLLDLVSKVARGRRRHDTSCAKITNEERSLHRHVIVVQHPQFKRPSLSHSFVQVHCKNDYFTSREKYVINGLI